MHKTIIFLFTLYCSNILIGMKIERKNNSIQLLKSIPNDIKKIILSHEKQWWHVKASIKHHGWITSAAISSCDTWLALLSDCRIHLYNIQNNLHLTDFSSISLELNKSLFFTNDNTEIVMKPYPTSYAFSSTSYAFNIQKFTNTRSRINYCYHWKFGFDGEFRCIDDPFFPDCSKSQSINLYDQTGPYNKKDPTSIKLHNNQIMECHNGQINIFSLYTNNTVEQVILKNAFNTWFLIEKPDKNIDSFEEFIKDVALKCDIPLEELVKIWFTLPEETQYALYSSIQHKIQKYGKYNDNNSCRCIIQ